MRIKGRDLTAEELSRETAVYGRVRSASEIRFEESKQEMRRIGVALSMSPDMKLLLDTLVELYYRGNMVGSDPQETYFNLGRRDVVEFLFDVRDRALKEK